MADKATCSRCIGRRLVFELHDDFYRRPEIATALTTPAAYREWLLNRGGRSFAARGHVRQVGYRKAGPGVIEVFVEPWTSQGIPMEESEDGE